MFYLSPRVCLFRSWPHNMTLEIASNPTVHIHHSHNKSRPSISSLMVNPYRLTRERSISHVRSIPLREPVGHEVTPYVQSTVRSDRSVGPTWSGGLVPRLTWTGFITLSLSLLFMLAMKAFEWLTTQRPSLGPILGFQPNRASSWASSVCV